MFLAIAISENIKMMNAYCLFFLYSFQAKLWITLLQALMDHLTQTEGGTGVQC